MAMGRKPKFGRIFRRKWKRPDGTVVDLETFWIEYYRDGKQQRESSRSPNYAVAENLLKQRLAEVSIGIAPAVSTQKTKVAALLDMLLEDYELNGKSLEWANYVVGHLRPFFGSMKAGFVGTDALSRYIAQRRANGIANSTINRELSLLRRAFNLGVNVQPRIVAAVPKIPKLAENNVRKGFFEHEEFIILRSELPEHLRPVISFAYSTGCRKGEILSLKWSQVDFKRRIVRLEPGETKNDDGRIVPLIGELHEMLLVEKQRREQQYPNCPWVFSKHGKRILNFYAAWEEASRRAGLLDIAGHAKRLFHDLRRTGVRNLIRAGVPERVAMMISGHKSRSVLDRYNVVDERDLIAAGARLEDYLNKQSKAFKYKSRTSRPKSTVSIPAKNKHQPPSNLLN